MIKMIEKSVINITLTEYERAVMKEAEMIIGELKKRFEMNRCSTIIAMETGEVIELKETSRVRGVLNGLANDLTWKMSK